jgi:hypothetical protein
MPKTGRTLTAATLVWSLFFGGCAEPAAPPDESALPAAPGSPAEAERPSGPTAPQASDAPPAKLSPLDRPNPPAGKRVEYQPGLIIDFARKRVEIECRVVLREGLLELLVCSPRTKEHESILVARPRPLHIYEALGLVGLTPGKPAAWDDQRQERIPPTGDELTIHITYERDGRQVGVNAWEWLKDLRADAAAPPRPWLFTGSLTSPRDGTFAADYNGNVISVVDFGTELIGLAEMHSADNEALWLTAFTDRIPPLGTSCTLLVQAVDDSEADGT